MIRSAALTLAAALLAMPPLHANAAGCVLPPPDGSDVEWSPPTVVGRILEVRPGLVAIRTAAGDSYPVALDETTDVFTAYGGGVEVADIRVGQYADIWLADCKAPAKALNRAAVIRMCSLAPEPCPTS